MEAQEREKKKKFAVLHFSLIRSCWAARFLHWPMIWLIPFLFSREMATLSCKSALLAGFFWSLSRLLLRSFRFALGSLLFQHGRSPIICISIRISKYVGCFRFSALSAMKMVERVREFFVVICNLRCNEQEKFFLLLRFDRILDSLDRMIVDRKTRNEELWKLFSEKCVESSKF